MVMSEKYKSESISIVRCACTKKAPARLSWEFLVRCEKHKQGDFIHQNTFLTVQVYKLRLSYDRLGFFGTHDYLGVIVDPHPSTAISGTNKSCAEATLPPSTLVTRLNYTPLSCDVTWARMGEIRPV